MPYVPTFTIQNHLRIHGSLNIHNRPMDLRKSWGKKNIIKGCRLLMRLLRKEGYMVWELKGGICVSPPTVGSVGLFWWRWVFSWGLLIVGLFWLIYIYILLRYTPFSLVWMCRLVWVFCCLSTWEIGDIDQEKCVCISICTLTMSISMCSFWVLTSFKLLTVMIFENSPVLGCWTNMCRKHTPSRTVIISSQLVSAWLMTMVIVSPLSDLFIADRWGWS